MTLEEAQTIARISEDIDGGCPCCIQGFLDSLNEEFPAWEWSVPEDSDHIIVKERVLA